MATDDRTAALATELDPTRQPPAIEFKLTVDGREEIVVVPCPTPMRAWLWILENLIPVGSIVKRKYDASAFATEIAARTLDVLAIAVELHPAQLRELPAEVLDPVLDKFAVQLWGEQHNAAPFSNTTLNRAIVVFNRKMDMLISSSRAAGTAPPSPSSPSSDAPGGK